MSRTKHNVRYMRRWKSKAGRLRDVLPRYMPPEPFERYLFRPASALWTRGGMKPVDVIDFMAHAMAREDHALWVRLHAIRYPQAKRAPRSTQTSVAPRLSRQMVGVDEA